MRAHAFFANLLVHTDHELSEALGSGIVERTTIHEWPLSWVQRVVLDDGRTLIYKSQLPPTVESQFYARVSSRLLPGHRRLDALGECVIMTIDWIDAPLLRDVAQRDTELVEHGHRVIAEIGALRATMPGEDEPPQSPPSPSPQPDRARAPEQRPQQAPRPHPPEDRARASLPIPIPIYLDIGSIDAWSANARIAMEKLRVLVQDRRFPSIDLDAVRRVETWTETAEVFAAVTANPRVTHGDLRGDQVFVTADGYRVIDWQRPIIAPPEIDLVGLLVGQRIEPCRFVDATMVRIFWFLRLCWAVEAQFDLFPAFRGPLFDGWSSQAVSCILT
jgi:hypothetical protein